MIKLQNIFEKFVINDLKIVNNVMIFFKIILSVCRLMYHPVWAFHNKSNNIDCGLEIEIENNDSSILWMLKTLYDILHLYRENIFFQNVYKVAFSIEGEQYNI